MHQFPEGFDFGELEAFVPGGVLALELLDGDDLLGLAVLGLLDATEGATAKL